MPKLINHYKVILTGGFAIFSMFFGAGNLVFPLMLGAECATHPTLASIGFLTTGILVPFLGLISIIFFNGNRSAFFNVIGRRPAFIMTTLMLCLMGPFGAIPRCILVAYGSVQLLFPWLPLEAFSLFFCLVNLILVWNYNRIVPIIGNILTPWLIISLLTLIVAGLLHATTGETPVQFATAQESLTLGFVKGYQTLDLLASFFFSATTIHFIKNHLAQKEYSHHVKGISALTCILGALMLGVAYIGLVVVGSKFAPILQGVSYEQILSVVGNETLGTVAVPVVAITIFLACLTTVAVLVTLFADFVNEDIFRNRIGRPSAIYLTLGISFVISLVGFMSLYNSLGKILVILYPALIALVIFNILAKVMKVSALGKWGFWLTFLVIVILEL